MKITDAEKKALKGRGYIMNRDGEHFIARIITEDGVLSSQEMITAAQAAEKFGNGNVAMTTRMTIEVQGLTYENIEPFDQFLKERGLYTGGTGPVYAPSSPVRAPYVSTASLTPRAWPGSSMRNSTRAGTT